jgi:hypothetical protein
MKDGADFLNTNFQWMELQRQINIYYGIAKYHFTYISVCCLLSVIASVIFFVGVWKVCINSAFVSWVKYNYFKILGKVCDDDPLATVSLFASILHFWPSLQ